MKKFFNSLIPEFINILLGIINLIVYLKTGYVAQLIIGILVTIIGVCILFVKLKFYDKS